MNALSQSQLHDKLGGAWHGNYFSCRCPFHDDDKPSLLVYADGGYCMGCRKSYSLQKLSGYAYNVPESRKEIYGPRIDWKYITADPVAFIESCFNNLCRNQHLFDELADRGLSYNNVTQDAIGYWEGWYVFPTHKIQGGWGGVVLRASKAIQQKSGHRYTTPPQQPDMLFFPGYMGHGKVYVTFGIFDAYSVKAATGSYVVTGTRGKGLKAKLLRDSGIREFTIIPDKGEEAAAYNLQKDLGLAAKVLVLDYPADCKDPNDVHVKYGRAALKDLIREKETPACNFTMCITREGDAVYDNIVDIEGNIRPVIRYTPGQIRPLDYTAEDLRRFVIIGNNAR